MGAFAASKVDYAAAVNACGFGIVVTDATQIDNPAIYVNPAFVEMTGYSFDETCGRNCRFLQGVDTSRSTIDEIRSVLSQGLAVRKQILNYRKDGSSFWNELTIDPVFDARGRITGFIGLLADITRQKQAQSQREEYEAQISRILANMRGPIFSRAQKADGSIPHIDSFPASTGWTFENGTDDVETRRRTVARSVEETAPIYAEFRLVGPDGETRWYRASSTPRREENGDTVWEGVGVDITREKESENRLSAIVENMPGYLFQRLRKPDGAISYPYVSPSFARMVGLSGEMPIETDIWKYIHPDDLEGVRASTEQSAKDMSHQVFEFRLLVGQRGERWIRASSSPRREKDGGVVWNCVAVDITTEKAIESRLAYLAHHDQLTGLANRALLTERLAEAIKAARESCGGVAVSQVLIVNFAEINETLGSEDLDAVLKSVAVRMSELALLDSQSVAARVGNSEFAILRKGASVVGGTDEFAQMLIRSIDQPILIGNGAVAISPCVGTANFSRGDLDHLSVEAAATEIMKRAAIAASAAAAKGAGSHRVYDENLDHRTRHRMQLRQSMRGALSEDQFELHYQPLVDLQTGSIVSAEALIRWRHPEFGLVRPDLFIGLAEESGLMGALGEWVLRRAMRQVKEWESNGMHPPKIALNVSGVQIGMPDFTAIVRKALADTGADARRFELELTEGFLLERSPHTLSVLGELKSLGFELVIDDFGAGHSNFQYLRNFPVDKLKIDQIFVRQLVADSNDALIIRAIASLASSLKLGLVAEGIETQEQREFLRDQGCPIGQGYFFSLPLAAEDFAWMIANEVILPMRAGAHGKDGVVGSRRQA